MNEEARNALEATTASVASKVTVGGAVVSFLSSSTFISLSSLLIAAIGLIVTVYYKARGDRRDQEEHEARMKRLQTESVRGILDGPRQAEDDESAAA